MMRHNLTRYTALARPMLAATLAVLLAVLWLLPGPTAALPHPAATLSPPTPDATDTAIGRWGDTALARPLFNPSRRPLDQTGPDADSGLPRLSAIIISGGASGAVFAADGQKPLVVGLGGMIAGYVLNRIAPDHVELSGPGVTLTLHPQFAAAAASPSADAPASVPDSPPPGQLPDPALNPATNPAMMIEQNF